MLSSVLIKWKGLMSMIGYKKCIYFSDDGNYRVFECIVQLDIPDDAKVVRPFISDKCN